MKISFSDKNTIIINKLYYSIELKNLLITLELILSTFWNTYITFIVEGKITDARSFRGHSISFFFIHVVFDNIYLYRLYC
jgi:hypothetical protein